VNFCEKPKNPLLWDFRAFFDRICVKNTLFLSFIPHLVKKRRKKDRPERAVFNI